jgi:hypothetical protein
MQSPTTGVGENNWVPFSDCSLPLPAYSQGYIPERTGPIRGVPYLLQDNLGGPTPGPRFAVSGDSLASRAANANSFRPRKVRKVRKVFVPPPSKKVDRQARNLERFRQSTRPVARALTA